MKSLVSQPLSRSLLSLLTCENCLRFPRKPARVYRQNLHSSIHRRDYDQSLSSFPQSSTPLDGPTGQLNVIRAHHNCLSEPFRLSESRKPGPIWLNQVLAQQDDLAERSRDHNRAGPFAAAEGWEDRLRDRNAGERTSVDRFVEFQVFN